MKILDPKTNHLVYFVDKCLPFGLAIAPAIFQRLSNALAYIFTQQTKEDTMNYLDDFFFGEVGEASTNQLVWVFLQICTQVGMPYSLAKTCWATRFLVFLGLLLDLANWVVALPLEKIQGAKARIKGVLHTNSCTVNQMQSIVGFLIFLCQAIVPGRPFLRRLIDSFMGIQNKPKWHVKFTREVKLDLKVWLEFLESPQAFYRPFLEKKFVPRAKAQLFTDAAAAVDKGMGGYCNGEWFSLQWPDGFIKIPGKEPSICYLELLGVATAILLWSHQFRNQRVRIWSDNQAAVNILNKLTSKCKDCMELVRLIVGKSIQENVKFVGVYLPGVHNTIADALSRQKLHLFQLAAPEAQPLPLPVPPSVWTILKRKSTCS